MKSNLTRKELAQAINEKLGISQRSAGELVDLVFSTLKQTLLNEESVKIVQFGTFTVRNKAPRMGRNPRTGETMEIAKRSMVSFKASKSLRQKINS
ncbi:MAG: integration host factor subunit alpha [Proteobacteria bacterium]|jgi:integration host factor subunit alpha|nr:integration host factor subunit alpha [Pseudomonadota bacterium]MBU4260728.1 integration host factor subunit alpha [Pseudomonadota bacterium]MBU4296895.1 integration host factor subunit alpha [Pseudomonadota bacterium]MCG2749273.1 integration host factor subunit alpha [Desulfobulbaceae bacterium]